MSKAMIEQTKGYLETALQQYKITDALISTMESEFMQLKIDGLDDADGYKAVREARMQVKKYRVDTEKTRKRLKEEALIFGRGVDGKAKEITGRLSPIETYLHDMEKAVDEEKLRIKNEAETKERERIQGRIKGLYDIGMVFDGFGYAYDDLHVSGEQITAMTDEEYIYLVADVEAIKQEKAAIQAEEDRKKKEEEDRLAKIRDEQEAESKRLAEEREKIRKEQEAKEAEIKAAQDKLEAEKKAIEKAKQDAIDKKTRQEEIEKAKKEAAEKAIKEKAEAEKKDAEEKEKAEKAARLEAELKEKLRPDNEKLIAFSDLIAGMEMPSLATEPAHITLTEARRHLDRAVLILRQGA